MYSNSRHILKHILYRISEIREVTQKADHDPSLEGKRDQKTKTEKVKGNFLPNLPGSAYCGKKRKGESCKIYTPIDHNTLTLTQRAYYLSHDLEPVSKVSAGLTCFSSNVKKTSKEMRNSKFSGMNKADL